MKKLIFGLIATVMFGMDAQAQYKTDLEAYSIIKREKINFSNIIIRSFLEISKIKSLHPEITIIENESELLTLKNNFQSIKLSINSSKATLIYAVYNSEKNEFIWFFINNTKSKIEILSPELDLISSFSNIKGFVHVDIISHERSVFGLCMDAVEEDVTDSFVGWVMWNTNPLVSATAAVACNGCAQGWWACPPAYTATLKK